MKEKYDNIDEYIADLKNAIAENDQCANHHYNLAQALLSKRDFAGAEECFLNAIRNSPRMAEAYVQLGGICLQYNEEAANCRPQNAIALSNIAFVHIQKGEPDKAISALNKALSWSPHFLQARNELATAYYMKGNIEGCEQACRNIIKDEPGFAPAWNNLALALFDQGRFDEAVQACDKAAELGFEVAQGFLDELKPHRK